MITKHKILLIDRHPEWLEFAHGVLSNDYDVVTLSKHEDVLLLDDQKNGMSGFDLTFIGLEVATDNLDLLKPLFNKWHFIVVFPIIQENKTVRLLFRAGVYDCARKPYDREGLLKLVADELRTAQVANGHSRVRSVKMPKKETLRQLANMLNLEDKS